MTVWAASTGTQSATVTTEHTLKQDSGANSFQAAVDLTNMVNGDITEIRVYEIINATARQIFNGIYANVQANPLVKTPIFASAGVTNGFKLTLKQSAGTSRNFDWETLKDTGAVDANVTQFGGSNGTFASGRPEVNTTHAAGTAWASGAITAASIAPDAIGASELAADAATEIGTAVWATATRVLTANTNLNDLSAAGIRTAVGLASANLDTQLTAIDDYIDTEVAAIKAKTDNLPASPAATGDAMALTSGERNSVADALLDRAAGVETGTTPRQSLRLMLAALVGKLSGAATTSIKIRDTNDAKDRITATVDSDGNRSAVTLDPS